ncbi:MAG: hypothetical protein RJQ21_18285 [Rhodospirillales bacterium]
MPRITARRLGSGPIIHEGTGPLGGNINGPSLIRAPDWIDRPLGRYYLYFAHHKGRSIRLAYADAIKGPWRLHLPGALDVSESLFVSEDVSPDGLSLDGDWAAKTGGGFLYAHVASPDVLVDEPGERLLMYFHGLLPDGEQMTRLATSRDGLSWDVLPPLLGPPYFRVFAWRERWYAICWGGRLLTAERPEGPFTQCPAVIARPPLAPEGTTIRHVAASVSGDGLELYYSRIGDTPECILRAWIRLDETVGRWEVLEGPDIVLAPRETWEGGKLPVITSRAGAADDPEHALRDPCLYTEGGRSWLLYSGAGEQAIGLAELSR